MRGSIARAVVHSVPRTTDCLKQAVMQRLLNRCPRIAGAAAHVQPNWTMRPTQCRQPSWPVLAWRLAHIFARPFGRMTVHCVRIEPSGQTPRAMRLQSITGPKILAPGFLRLRFPPAARSSQLKPSAHNFSR